MSKIKYKEEVIVVFIYNRQPDTVTEWETRTPRKRKETQLFKEPETRQRDHVT